MKLRLLSLTLLASLSAASHASFELALMLTNNGITRYDPVNRINLGSFANGELGFYGNASIAWGAATPNEVAVLNGDGVIRRWDYATGLYQGGFSTGYTTLYSNSPLRLRILSNGNYLMTGYVAGTTTAISKIFTSSGSVVATLSPFGGAYQSLDTCEGADGNIYNLTRYQSGSTYYFYNFVYNASGTYLGYSNLGTSTTYSTYGTLAPSGNSIIVGTGYGSTSLTALKIALGTSQTGTAISGSYYLSTGWSNMVAGHFGRTHVVQSFSNTSGGYSTYWYNYDPLNGLMSISHQLPYTTSIGDIALVTAPEPGAYAAMGFGVLGLLLKRRRR